jgi:hypothetical protein
VQSVNQRLPAAADKRGLTAEPGWQIVGTPKNFEGEYETLADDRREALRSEPKAVGETLTQNQRETVRNDFQGRGVVDTTAARKWVRLSPDGALGVRLRDCERIDL